MIVIVTGLFISVCARVPGQYITDILKERGAFTFEIKQAKTLP